MAAPGLTILFLILFGAYFFSWIWAWVSIGTPEVLRRFAIIVMIAIVITTLVGFMKLRMFLYLPKSLIAFIFSKTIPFLVASATPFVCIFINARRYDKTLKFGRSFKFWLPAQTGSVTTAGYMEALDISVEDPLNESRGSFCPHCGKELPQGAKFCDMCGGNVNE